MIKGLGVEVQAGMPSLYADVEGLPTRLPIQAVSGGLSRILSILLIIASRNRSILIIDEIENGIFHSRKPQIWRALSSFAEEYNCQLFISTHDEEFLLSLAKDNNIDLGHVALFRAERPDQENSFRYIEGNDILNALSHGIEIR